jgi:Leucine-rich repeat (LRR) protein
MITADYKPNKNIATNKANGQHNEIKSRFIIAQRSNALHLSNMNIAQVLPEVFKMDKLVRLDLSFNNIVKLSP